MATLASAALWIASAGFFTVAILYFLGALHDVHREATIHEAAEKLWWACLNLTLAGVNIMLSRLAPVVVEGVKL